MWIDSFSLSPEGNKIVTIDYEGSMVLSDVDTNEVSLVTPSNVEGMNNENESM